MTDATDHPIRVLFVCVGNACRSQMAEAWAKHFAPGRVLASSAGMMAFGSIPESTAEVMAEAGVSLDGQRSKGLREVQMADMDVVVTMGYEVECTPPAGFKGQAVQWEIPDPFGRSLDCYRNVRDMIERKVLGLLADLLPPSAPWTRAG